MILTGKLSRKDWWNDTDRGILSRKNWWNDTDRGILSRKNLVEWY